MRPVREKGPKATVAQIKGFLGSKPCYLTFDIDARDPAFAQGTRTPVGGGLTNAQAAIILRDLAGISILHCDVVAVSSPSDTTGVAVFQVPMQQQETYASWVIE